MRIGLAAYQCKNGDLSFNMYQIERAMKCAAGKADVLCFGEAFLQGFDSLCWNYKEDAAIAVEQSSAVMKQLQRWTSEYGLSLICGYIEKEQDRLYSSCIVLSEGEILHNYRRISRGWKEYTRTDAHYCEGEAAEVFSLHGKQMTIALCGDLWEYPQRLRTASLLIWPVYLNFTIEQWEQELDAYAAQAALAADDAVLINPIDLDPVSHGGAFCFHQGQVVSGIPFDQEDILFIEL
ncbi:MAG: carbon-nitrogen hydrolase family protein [Solobacterium sp.]|nr:carbon-nitrogen hydrolase family protein [Solobacterium sp.]